VHTYVLANPSYKVCIPAKLALLAPPLRYVLLISNLPMTYDLQCLLL